MPEKAKRRKNKNKRKNKNIRNDVNKCDDEVIEKESEESCSSQINNDETLPIHEEHDSPVAAEDQLHSNATVESPVIPEVVCSDVLSVSEDVNNNDRTHTVDTLQVPALHSVSNNCADDVNTEVLESDTYIVESPEQPLKAKPKLTKTVKSKSLDNDDTTKIVDITDDITSQSEEDTTVAVMETGNVLISDVESDVEWEKTDELNDVDILLKKDVGTLSLTTMPLNVAQCQEISTSLTPDVETSLRNYLRTLDLSTHPENVNSVEIKAEIEQLINREIRHRLRKKALADEVGLQRLGPPRILDVIDEEGSGESSKSSRRQSYLSDRKSDIEDLEDDVFEDKNKVQEKISRRTETTFHHKKTFGRLVPQQCMLVGAKIKNPEVTEARGDWTMQTVEKMTGAEVVYLTDSSSSTSSLHDYGDETDDGMETDVSVRMITPTIEVTDTEHLLKNSFITQKSENNLQDVKKINEHIIKIDYEKDNQKQALFDSAQNTHEIVVLSTDNIQTNLYVKDVEPSQLNNAEPVTKESTKEKTQNMNDKYDLEIKVLKCELNDAINNLIKEVSDSELNDSNIETFARQDSSSSVSSSQCTAKYNPTSSSLNDVSNILHDDTCENDKSNPGISDLLCAGSHVKDVIEHVAGTTTEANNTLDVASKEPSYLRDICVRRIASLPYGDKILEELASVSKRIQNITGAFTTDRLEDLNSGEKDQPKKYNMPFYQLPEVSPVEKVILPTKCKENVAPPVPVPPRHSSLKKTSREEETLTGLHTKPESVPPPVPMQPRHLSQRKISQEEQHHTGVNSKVESVPLPVPMQPRLSSLKKISREEEVWTGVPTKTEPVYVCLSPSQKMLMEKTQTVITKEDASELTEMHKKYVDRRGFSENTTYKQRNEIDNEVSPVVPFKSQTGSRLLALIRDPTVTSSINSYNRNSSLNQSENKSTIAQTTSTNHHNRFENISNTFKPIPPPRPKKMASSWYESDESSDFTDSSMRSMKSDRKFFHFSTGNLNKEIEDDISSIQNMHRYYTNTRDSIRGCPRRPSLPKDLCDQQMEYIRQKEKEVEAEIKRLETLRSTVPSSAQKLGPRAPLLSENEVINENIKDSNNYFISKRRNFFASLSTPEESEKTCTNVNHKKEKGKLSSVFSSSQEELLREKMYSEYVTQMAQREERKQHKVIKITDTLTAPSTKISKSMPSIDVLDSKVNNRIEKEFISKARERWDKLGIKDPETEDEKDIGNNVYREPKVIEHKIKVIEGGQEKDVKNLPRHLQDFVRFTAKDKEQRTDSSGESQSDPASPHVMIWCAVLIIALAVGKYFLRLFRNQ